MDHSPVADVATVVDEEWRLALDLSTAADDDFFSLGGNSVTAVRMAQRIEQRLGITFPLEVLFLDGTRPAVTRACADLLPGTSA